MVPADPAYANLAIHELLAAFVPGANALDLVLSNAQTVTIGSMAPLGRGSYIVATGSDPNANLAAEVAALGYAVRLGTL